MENQRNIILAVLLTALVLFGWDAGMKYIYPQSNVKHEQKTEAAKAGSAPAEAKHTREGGIERPFAQLREELAAALARAAEGKGDRPRKPQGKPGPRRK